MESSHKPDTVREFTKMPRSEDQIREDLKQQLESIYRKQQSRWLFVNETLEPHNDQS